MLVGLDERPLRVSDSTEGSIAELISNYLQAYKALASCLEAVIVQKLPASWCAYRLWLQSSTP